MSEIKKINETYDILLDLKRDFKKDLATEAVDPGNNVDFKDGAVKNSFPSRDNINQQLLKDVQDAAKAANVNVSITTAQSGHESLPSRHPSGNAIDIAIINGKAVSPSNRSDADQFVNALVKMGYVKNSESGNPKAVLTFGFKGHDNHVHVSNQGDSSSAVIQHGTTQPGTTKPETTQPDEDDVETKFLTKMAGQMGLKEEKIYSKLGDRILINNRSIIIPSNNNTTIKSPINGVITNNRSNTSCINQLIIQHSIENKLHYLKFCGISDPQVKDGKKISKGDILGKTSTDVTVSLFDESRNQIPLNKMLDKEVSKDAILNKKNNRNNYEYKKETEYYDPFYPWIGKKILGLGKKIPSMTKGGESKIKNFFNKHSMTSKKVDENIERIKKLLK
jgi:hypothetical protein